ncbi:hypothetical protein Tco_1557437, partial [Tanacetum coccineum]
VNGTLPELVKLLHGKVHATTYEAIQTLLTLVEKESPRRGAHVFHESEAVVPILEVLNWGSELSKVEALKVLEKVMLTKMVDWYMTSSLKELHQIMDMAINITANSSYYSVAEHLTPRLRYPLPESKNNFELLLAV